MSKKTLLLLILVIGLIAGAGFLLFNLRQNASSTKAPDKTEVEIKPSETLKSYTDPAGFSFNYPDNLSLVNYEPEDNNTYADIQLTAKGLKGSLNLKIIGSKLISLKQWLKGNQASPSATPKEVKLANLKASEIATNDKVLLGALDQGVLFTINVPFEGKQDFWLNVYNKVIKDFSFVSPTQDKTASQGGSGSSDGVIFEGEEVVE